MATVKTPGPKPPFLIVEHNLKCQTSEGEISLDLRIPLVRLEQFMDMESIDTKLMPRYLLDHVISADDKAKIEGLKDGVEGFKILMRFAESVGERLGHGLGESSGSTSSSENTVEPSGTTSAPDSE